MGVGGGQVGFDEGALFEVMAKPKRVKVTRKFDDDHNCIEETTSTLSYWDAVMIIGGPTLIFAMVSAIKWIGMKLPDWLGEDEANFYLEHPLLMLAAGPAGSKIVYEAYKFATDPSDVQKVLAGASGRLMLSQVSENWGFRSDEDLPGGGKDKDKSEDRGWKDVIGDIVKDAVMPDVPAAVGGITEVVGEAYEQVKDTALAGGTAIGNRPNIAEIILQALIDRDGE
ncbi:unnamed protein product [marine sediment metagenome]|uniref:Uncharacterized protein n=1 Tax=marine sediment metagenome TaxID=412755 RepID=X1UCU7_9ZZZZ